METFIHDWFEAWLVSDQCDDKRPWERFGGCMLKIYAENNNIVFLFMIDEHLNEAAFDVLDGMKEYVMLEAKKKFPNIKMLRFHTYAMPTFLTGRSVPNWIIRGDYMIMFGEIECNLKLLFCIDDPTEATKTSTIVLPIHTNGTTFDRLCLLALEKSSELSSYTLIEFLSRDGKTSYGLSGDLSDHRHEMSFDWNSSFYELKLNLQLRAAHQTWDLEPLM